MNNNNGIAGVARPAWASAAWCFENYGIGRATLNELAAAGKIRAFKSGKAMQCAKVYNVADLDAYMEANSSPLAPEPPEDNRPEATEEDFAEMLRRGTRMMHTA